MKRARISELRDRLSEFLDHVRSGGRVLVLDRDKPIAEIVPLARPGSTSQEDADLLRALERAGIVRLPSAPLENDLEREQVPGKGAGVLDALLDERDSSR